MELAFVSRRPLSLESFTHLEKPLIKLFGRSAATVLIKLQEFLRQSRNVIDGVYWVYNTYAQWKDQIPGLSIRTLQRVMRQLEALGIIQSERYEAHRWYQRKWYTIDYDRLKALILSIPPNCDDPCRQNGEFINKDISANKIKETNTREPTLQPLNPSTHPVMDLDKEVNKGVTGLQAFQTGDHQIKEKPQIKKIQDPQPHTSVHPKPKLKQSLNSEPETIAAPVAEIPAEIEAQILEAIAPAPMNQNLRKHLLQAQAEVIIDAIALVQQQKKQGKAKNPAGLLVKAIQHQWKPNPSNTVPKLIPDDFNEWFDLARRSGLAIASSMIDDVLCIYTNAQKWEPYEDFRAGFSLPWLKKMLQIP